MTSPLDILLDELRDDAVDEAAAKPWPMKKAQPAKKRGPRVEFDPKEHRWVTMGGRAVMVPKDGGPPINAPAWMSEPKKKAKKPWHQQPSTPKQSTQQPQPGTTKPHYTRPGSEPEGGKLKGPSDKPQVPSKTSGKPRWGKDDPMRVKGRSGVATKTPGTVKKSKYKKKKKGLLGRLLGGLRGKKD